MSEETQSEQLTETAAKKLKSAQKQEAPRRGYEGLQLMTQELRKIAAPVLGKRGFAGTDILESWTDILGPDLSLGVRPEKLTFTKDSRTHGTLHVKSAGGAFAMLFEHQKQRVIERINAFFGYPAVSSVKIMQGRLSLQAPTPQKVRKKPTPDQLRLLKKKVAQIEDEELRRITYEIGLSLLEQKQTD